MIFCQRKKFTKWLHIYLFILIFVVDWGVYVKLPVSGMLKLVLCLFMRLSLYSFPCRKIIYLDYKPSYCLKCSHGTFHRKIDCSTNVSWPKIFFLWRIETMQFFYYVYMSLILIFVRYFFSVSLVKLLQSAKYLQLTPQAPEAFKWAFSLPECY